MKEISTIRHYSYFDYKNVELIGFTLGFFNDKIKLIIGEAYSIDIEAIGFFDKIYTHKKSADPEFFRLINSTKMFSDTDSDKTKIDVIQIIIYSKFFTLLSSHRLHGIPRDYWLGIKQYIIFRIFRFI